MKTFAVLALALASTLASAQTATFTKRGAEVETNRTAAGLKFSITSTAGQNRCELEGTAEPVDKDRFAFTDNDPAERCVAVLNMTGGKLAVTTKGCAGYCGAGAGSSMDGTYTKAK